jgi:hypothetical protein
MRPTTTLDPPLRDGAPATLHAAAAFAARHENPYPRTPHAARHGAGLVSLRTQSHRRFLDRRQRALADARWPMVDAGRLALARDCGDAAVRVARATSIPRFERVWRVAVVDCALDRRSRMRDDVVAMFDRG